MKLLLFLTILSLNSCGEEISQAGKACKNACGDAGVQQYNLGSCVCK